MALAEAGYTDAGLEWRSDPVYSGVAFHCTLACGPSCDPALSVPCDIGWRALVLADGYSICWPCHSRHDDYLASDDCGHDPLTSPWPPLPSPVSGP